MGGFGVSAVGDDPWAGYGKPAISGCNGAAEKAGNGKVEETLKISGADFAAAIDEDKDICEGDFNLQYNVSWEELAEKSLTSRPDYQKLNPYQKAVVVKSLSSDLQSQFRNTTLSDLVGSWWGHKLACFYGRGTLVEQIDSGIPLTSVLETIEDFSTAAPTVAVKDTGSGLYASLVFEPGERLNVVIDIVAEVPLSDSLALEVGPGLSITLNKVTPPAANASPPYTTVINATLTAANFASGTAEAQTRRYPIKVLYQGVTITDTGDFTASVTFNPSEACQKAAPAECSIQIEKKDAILTITSREPVEAGKETLLTITTDQSFSPDISKIVINYCGNLTSAQVTKRVNDKTIEVKVVAGKQTGAVTLWVVSPTVSQANNVCTATVATGEVSFNVVKPKKPAAATTATTERSEPSKSATVRPATTEETDQAKALKLCQKFANRPFNDNTFAATCRKKVEAGTWDLAYVTSLFKALRLCNQIPNSTVAATCRNNVKKGIWDLNYVKSLLEKVK